MTTDLTAAGKALVTFSMLGSAAEKLIAKANKPTKVHRVFVPSPKMNPQKHSDKYCGDCGFKVRGKDHVNGQHHKNGTKGRCQVGTSY